MNILYTNIRTLSNNIAFKNIAMRLDYEYFLIYLLQVFAVSASVGIIFQSHTFNIHYLFFVLNGQKNN